MTDASAVGLRAGPVPATAVRPAVARRYQQLTAAERRVADVVLAAPARVVALTIGELARELGVGSSVISRFCRRAGVGGYRELRLALARELGAEGATTDGARGTSGETHAGGRPVWHAALGRMQDDVAAIERNIEWLDPTAMAAAAALIAGATRVVTVGYEMSGAVARRLATMLLHNGWRARAEADPADDWWTHDIGAADLVVAISHRGHSHRLVPVLPAIRTRGPRLLAITNDPESPIAREADLVLATCMPGGTTWEAYVRDPVFPVQVVTIRGLAAAAVAARDGGGLR